MKLAMHIAKSKSGKDAQNMLKKKFAIFSLFFVALGLIASIQVLQPAPLIASVTEDFDQNRARLLSYVLRRQIESHFSAKSIDDQLSEAAFDLYLKQLDFQKRLLLADEVEQLRVYEDRIDDEINTGQVVLAPLGASLIQNGLNRAEKMVADILAQPFDFNVDEDYETDPDKLSFCKTVAELRERWRTDLKFRTLNRYLSLLEDHGQGMDPDQVPEEKRIELEKEAREKIAKQYHDFFERQKKETVKDHYERYLNAFARAFDPHTSYMAPQSKEDFDISMRGSLEGIGATLREEDGYIKVVKVIPGSAADRQGQLHADDVILAVGEGVSEPVDVTDMRLRDAVALIRGDKGTEVRLTVRRVGHKPFVIPIVRDVVIIEESFVKSATISPPGSKNLYGYIKIPSFYRDFEGTRNGGEGRNSTEDVKLALKELSTQKIDGLVLDLRNNGGGALTDAVGVTGLFIEKGPVVQVKNGSGDTKVLYDHDPFIGYQGPMVVLINHLSASASEIVAGALQDYGRAIIIGSDHTHGKGTVQVVMDLDYTLTLRNMRQYMPLGALKITTQKFYRVSGDSTQYRGVIPDIVLPDRNRNNKFGERYLDYSLPWDAIPAVDHSDWNMDVDKQVLRSRSFERVTENDDFNEIQRMSEILAKRIENTRQSLKIDEVYHERNDFLGDTASPHGGFQMDSAEDDDKSEEADERLSDEERLLKSVKNDPYALEAMAILSDMRDQAVEIAAKTPKK